MLPRSPRRLALALTLAAAASPAAATDFQRQLDEVVAAGAVGVTAVIDLPGQPLWTGAAGLADVARGEAMTPGHAVHLASITKQFTAAAVLRLVDAGRLGLDDRIAERLDGVELPPLPHFGEITVRQLLDHSSGLAATNNHPDYIRQWVGEEAGRANDWRDVEFLRLAGGMEPSGEPGSGHFYSDTNYILLGMLIEAITGETIAAHVRRTLFEPLGMRSAYYLSELAPGAGPPARTARGYLHLSPDLDPFFAQERFLEVAPSLYDTTSAGERIPGAGAIVATAGDLHRFAAAWLRGDLLSPASRDLVLAAADGLADAEVGTRRQRMASGRRTPFGVLWTAEGDGPGGSNTLVAYHPASGVLVVALVNSFGRFDETDHLLAGPVAAAVEVASR